MSLINSNTNVYIWLWQNGQRAWINKVDNVKDKRSDQWVLMPALDDDPAYATPYSYETALIIRRRLLEDRPTRDIHFSLSPTGEEIASGSTTSSPDKDNRVVMQFKGVLVRPFIPRGWCVHLFDGPRQLESVRDDTIEGAVNKVIERGQFKFAEKAAPEPLVAPELEKIHSGPRVRPGDLQP
jgi:hypothetical protein